MTTFPFPPGSPAPLAPSTSIRRALLFLLICAPIWAVPSLIAVGHPIVLVGAAIALSHLFLRYEGRSLAVLGLDASWRRLGQLGAGFAGGALLIVMIALVTRLVLPIPWAWNPHFSAGMAAWSLLWLLSGNAVEELVFRGYSFERLIAGWGHWQAQLFTALLFAVFHVVNGWPWQVALLGTTVGSLLFGLVFVRWRSVPAAAGVHAAVNWTRDLLLTDPPTVKTLLAPLSPRPWTAGEQLSTMLLMDGAFLLVCIALAISIKRRRLSAAQSG
ncbi:CPBP family intramembrane glutamic endopeptidase [Roseateles sp. P5_E1]